MHLKMSFFYMKKKRPCNLICVQQPPTVERERKQLWRHEYTLQGEENNQFLMNANVNPTATVKKKRFIYALLEYGGLTFGT